MSIVVAATTTRDLSSFHLSPSSSSFYLWHSHLGHVSSSCLRFLTSTRTLENLKTCDIFYCSGCKLAKFSVLPFNWRISISSSSSDLIYSYVWGPSPVAIKRGSWYYVFFYWWSYSFLLGLFNEISFWILWDTYRLLSSCQNSILYSYQML